MKNFLVVWNINITAANSEDAARQALTIQRDPSSIATVFEVIDDDIHTQVDLHNIEPSISFIQDDIEYQFKPGKGRIDVYYMIGAPAFSMIKDIITGKWVAYYRATPENNDGTPGEYNHIINNKNAVITAAELLDLK